MAPSSTTAPVGSLVHRFNRKLMLIGALMTMVFVLIVALAVFNRFDRLEQREVASHFARADALLVQQSEALKARSLDWAVWDETWQFLVDGNASYITANLEYASIANLDVNGMAFIRNDGALHHVLYADHSAGGMDAARARRFGSVAQETVRSARLTNSESVEGFAVQGDRLLALSVTRVLRSDGTGPSVGYLVMGRELSNADVSAALALPASIEPGVPASAPAVTSSLERLDLARAIPGIDGRPVALVRFHMPRVLLGEGLRLVALAAIGALVTGLLLVGAVGGMVRQMLLTPLRAFQHHVAAISSSGDLLPYTGEQRDDELGRLYQEFNAMVAEMTALRSKVEAQSYIIGKRDNSVSVMHNIGNGIGPVKTILSRLEGELVPSTQHDVQRALDELVGDAEAGSRRAQLAEFVRAALAFDGEAAAARRDLVRMALRSVDTVEGIITSTMNEVCSDHLAPQASDVGPILATCAALARQRDAAITITLDCPARFPVRANRVLLAQVFENLLKNAVEAIGASGCTDGRISITGEAAAIDGQPGIRVVITDNGDGFAPDQAGQLFERGFTSRAKKIGGIGLHWCANTVTAMGGRLELASDGKGCGARAVVLLPLERRAKAAGSVAAAQQISAPNTDPLLNFVI
jgi:signal transduction histidine kinase